MPAQPTGTQMVLGDVHGNTRDPRRETGFSAIAVDGANRLHERGLDQIFEVRRGADQPRYHALNRNAVFSKHRGNCCRLARTAPGKPRWPLGLAGLQRLGIAANRHVSISTTDPLNVESAPV
jgi:hypothetical protein